MYAQKYTHIFRIQNCVQHIENIFYFLYNYAFFYIIMQFFLYNYAFFYIIMQFFLYNYANFYIIMQMFLYFYALI